MIQELINSREKYLLSRSANGIIIFGGYNHGRFYGQVEIILTVEKAIVRTTVSDGVSLSISLADIEYLNVTTEYQSISKLNGDIDHYLDNADTIKNQELNREKLLQNLFDLLPKYDEVIKSRI